LKTVDLPLSKDKGSYLLQKGSHRNVKPDTCLARPHGVKVDASKQNKGAFESTMSDPEATKKKKKKKKKIN